MRKPIMTVLFAVLALLATLVVPATVDAASHANPPGPPPLPAHAERPVCGPPVAGTAACHAHVVTTPDKVTPLATSSFQYGLTPADLQSAYKLSPSGSPGSGPTVAIVDAYDNPNAEADLNAYRSEFKLGACTTANGCFEKVDQNGGTNYPRGDTGWGAEIDLDIEMVAATCPNCKILLVEAASNSFANLMAAVDYATANAAVVSNSYGASEFSGETNYESHFKQHPGVAITVSSGDAGYGVEYPAASQYVTAVGGTHLTTGSNIRGWSETAWSGAGSGCSSVIPKPSWQTGFGCAKRTVADVSAVADPNTGVAVYDSYGSRRGQNWYVYGGTSVAAPIIAGVYALAGPTGDYPVAYSYTHVSNLYDVTSGSNGSCGGSYLCTAKAGYDGPTGLGTPDTAAAFGGGGGGGGTTTTTATTTTTTTTTSTTTTTVSSELTVTAQYKDHGYNVVNLAWTGDYSYVFRDGALASGPSPVSSPFTDNTGQRGSSTYSYKVCTSNSAATCSIPVTVIF